MICTHDTLTLSSSTNFLVVYNPIMGACLMFISPHSFLLYVYVVCNVPASIYCMYYVCRYFTREDHLFLDGVLVVYGH